MEPAERQRLNELVARLADGDREAFHPVFLSLAPLLRRFARRRLAAEDAEDVAQEALDGQTLESRTDHIPTPEDAAIARSLDAALDDALRTLPARDQETLRAYARDERTLGVPPATFRKRVERGLARLRRSFSPDRRSDERS